MARNATASIGNLSISNGEDRRQPGRKSKLVEHAVKPSPRLKRVYARLRRAMAGRGNYPSPPQAAAGGGAGLYLVGHGHRAIERAVERREHAALDEIEGGGLAVARARQIADDFLVHSAGMR